MCVIVQKKYVALMLLIAYRAAGLCVNVLKYNIDMNIEEYRFWLAERTYFHQYVILRPQLTATLFARKDEYLAQLM